MKQAGGQSFIEDKTTWRKRRTGPQLTPSPHEPQKALLQSADRSTRRLCVVRAGISQPRMNDLVKGRILNFTLYALVNEAAKLGYRQAVIQAGGLKQ